jgi:hypothetical protein
VFVARPRNLHDLGQHTACATLKAGREGQEVVTHASALSITPPLCVLHTWYS